VTHTAKSITKLAGMTRGCIIEYFVGNVVGSVVNAGFSSFRADSPNAKDVEGMLNAAIKTWKEDNLGCHSPHKPKCLSSPELHAHFLIRN
jgi:hypothetical protein